MEAKATSTALETKLTQLRIMTECMHGILEKAKEEAITCHQTVLQTIINNVENLRLAVEAKKITEKEDLTEWSAKINNTLADADSRIQATKQWLEDNQRKQQMAESEEKL